MGRAGRSAEPGEEGSERGTVEEALALFRARGGRVTNARRLILTRVLTGSRHYTAEELAAEVQSVAPDVHVSTVYRNLEELERLGVVVHAHLGHGPATYYLAAEAHGHLVCACCGSVIEAPAELFESLSEAAHRRYGFAIDPGHFSILGRCSACWSQELQRGAAARSARGR